MQYPKDPNRNAIRWGIPLTLGFCVIAVVLYFGPFASLETTYQKVERKIETLSLMRINLLKSVEMEKNAVMALTDEESQGYADQSLAASAVVDRYLNILRSLLDEDPVGAEKELVIEFERSWTELRKLDRVILELAVQNTNLKAAALSREKGVEVMQRFDDALEAAAAARSGMPNEGRFNARLLHAMASGQKIYNLHGTHIAETRDEKMDQIETLMKAEEAKTRQSLDELTGMAGEKNRESLAQAKVAFFDLMELTSRVIKLSRQNSNLKSLELSLGRKRTIAAQCDEILATLQETVRGRTVKATR